MEHVTPLTQKAQGIMAIQDGCRVLGLKDSGSPMMVIPGSKWTCDSNEIFWPMFARPCPFRPRHGFVDSIRVDCWGEVIDLLQKAKTADPKHPVEIVLAPLLTGRVSAVATNAGVTWGYKNDGVTAGKDPHAVLIPVKTSKVAWRDAVSMMSMDLEFKIPSFPYLEIVENEGDMCLVQIRDGPEQPEGVNHVVRKTKVRRVLKADPSMDLLEWESLVHLAAEEKGTVIWAPYMSLASHFCVHGIESGVPVITDHRVEVGDVLYPTKNRTSTLEKRNYTKIASLIVATLNSDLHFPNETDQKHAILTAIATVQAQFCWGKESHLLRLRGLSIAILLKAVLASCAGEIRHWPSSDGPRSGSPSVYEIIGSISDCQFHRYTIYDAVFNNGFSFSKMKKALSVAATDLSDHRWKRSFGGPRWAEVANTGVELVKAAKHFHAAPGSITWSKVVQRANRLINTSHNNGKCLTKWIDSAAMSMITLSPTAGFLNSYTAQVVLQISDKGTKP